VDKVIKDVEDDKETVMQEKSSSIDFVIHDFDSDWVDLDVVIDDPSELPSKTKLV
jgi:hypothetical protein